MFGIPAANVDLNQPRGPITSLKEEPLGTRPWIQSTDQSR